MSSIPIVLLMALCTSCLPFIIKPGLKHIKDSDRYSRLGEFVLVPANALAEGVAWLL